MVLLFIRVLSQIHHFMFLLLLLLSRSQREEREAEGSIGKEEQNLRDLDERKGGVCHLGREEFHKPIRRLHNFESCGHHNYPPQEEEQRRI
jgi:hypothetical protein